MFRRPLLLIVCGIAMDQAIFHLINEQWTNPALDLFMAVLSDEEIWTPFLILAGVCILVFGKFHGRVFVLCLLLALLFTDQITHVLKSAFDRHRPKQVQSVRMVVLQKAWPKFLTVFKTPSVRFSDQSDHNRSGPSFPSGHMMNNTVIAICCTLFYRRRGWLYWFVAVTIGYSRIYLGAHWPSDIVGTLFLAAGLTLLLLGALELLWRWAGPKWMARLSERHPHLVVDAKPS